MLKSADISLYKAKISGRNRAVFFAHQMLPDVQQWTNDMDVLKTAMRQNIFICYWQAVVNSPDDVVWSELLIQLPTEDKRLLSSGEFLPSAEEAGLMGNIADFIIKISIDLLSRNNSSFTI